MPPRHCNRKSQDFKTVFPKDEKQFVNLPLEWAAENNLIEDVSFFFPGKIMNT